jgi:hypothetical protein
MILGRIPLEFLEGKEWFISVIYRMDLAGIDLVLKLSVADAQKPCGL